MSHIDHKKFAKVFKEGDPESGVKPGNIQRSMLAAGYSEGMAKKGRAGLTGKCLDAMLSEGIQLGKRYTPEERASFVRGKLIMNAATGEDKGVKSLELLGKDKEVGLFTSDSQVGVIILTAPTEYKVSGVIEPPEVGVPVDVVEG